MQQAGMKRKAGGRKGREKEAVIRWMEMNVKKSLFSIELRVHFAGL
jgi:hypothetical protein